jgi:hypothetical protein
MRPAKNDKEQPQSFYSETLKTRFAACKITQRLAAYFSQL